MGLGVVCYRCCLAVGLGIGHHGTAQHGAPTLAGLGVAVPCLDVGAGTVGAPVHRGGAGPVPPLLAGAAGSGALGPGRPGAPAGAGLCWGQTNTWHSRGHRGTGLGGPWATTGTASTISGAAVGLGGRLPVLQGSWHSRTSRASPAQGAPPAAAAGLEGDLREGTAWLPIHGAPPPPSPWGRAPQTHT